MPDTLPTMSTELDQDSILTFTKQLARDVGLMMKNGQERRMRAEALAEEEKASSVDLVTDVDKAVETYMREQISKTYPDHEFIGEETYKGEPITDAPTWIVDPIDGTTNFVHSHPDACTSIGLAIGGIPVVGVIYNPFLDHMYSAAKGKGAYFNDAALPLYARPRPLPSLSKALKVFFLHDDRIHPYRMIMVDCASRRNPSELVPKFTTYHRLAAKEVDGGKMVHSLRISGSAACSIAMTARGAVDMYAEIGARPWDVCAGICILAESGGTTFGAKTSDLDGIITKELLTGRKFLFMRNILPEKGETPLEAQQRIAREYFSVAEDYNP